MSLQTSGVRRLTRWLSALALLAVAGTGCAFDLPRSTLDPHTDFTRMVDGVFMTTVWWALGVFILVEGALVYAIFRYRGREGDAHPNQVHGNTTLEIVWTIIPALILAGIAVPTVRAIFKTYEVPTGNALEVQVIGHQWWWEFRYPEYKLITANELHVPIGRTVALKMDAADVLHAFWTPKLASKRDVFPNRTTTLWFTAEREGLYPGQCAEFCGLQHGLMGFYVKAESQADFDAYVSRLRATGAQAAASPATPAAAGVTIDSPEGKATEGKATTTATLAATAVAASQDGAAKDGATQDTAKASTGQAAAPAQSRVAGDGAKLFAAKGCLACHSLDANRAIGIGPNLANIGGRTHLAAGWLPNTDENLARWIQNPQAIKEGVLMPNLGLTDAEAQVLADYLRTFK